MGTRKIGKVDEIVVSILNLTISPSKPILIGNQNWRHIESEHPEAFKKYGGKIEEIINEPDYVAKHPKKDSIEYIKVYYNDDKEDYVLVAVRATKKDVYFARTLFIMSDEKVKKYHEKGAFHEYNKEP